jgi:hypothetical protein
MRSFARSLAVLLAASAALSGCSPFEGLDGRWSPGELGRTRWQISDGLCPGLGGGCALDVPLAEGARTTLEIDGVDGAELTAEVTGALGATAPVTTGEGENARLDVVASGPGTGRIAISDASGLVDRASVEVRRATRLECGRWPQIAGAVPWDMAGLDVTTSFSLPFVGAEETATIDLVCRASDAGGPLLSADAIAWTVVEGSEALELAETGLIIIPATVVRGARITYHTPGRGTAVVRVTIGDVTQDLTITVE